jgi:hypothetical protein
MSVRLKLFLHADMFPLTSQRATEACVHSTPQLPEVSGAPSPQCTASCAQAYRAIENSICICTGACSADENARCRDRERELE